MASRLCKFLQPAALRSLVHRRVTGIFEELEFAILSGYARSEQEIKEARCEARRAGAIRRPRARRGGGGVICDGGHAAPRNARGA